jgi:hypothetical protein
MWFMLVASTRATTAVDDSSITLPIHVRTALLVVWLQGPLARHNDGTADCWVYVGLHIRKQLPQLLHNSLQQADVNKVLPVSKQVANHVLCLQDVLQTMISANLPAYYICLTHCV